MPRSRSNQHILERRAGLLADKLKKNMNDLTESLQAAGGRIPFKTKLSKGSALDWWAQHRYDQLGQRALSSLDPASIMSLDAELAKYNQSQDQGLPTIGNAPTEPMGVMNGPDNSF